MYGNFEVRCLSYLTVFFLVYFLFSPLIFQEAYANNSPDHSHSTLSASGQAPADGNTTINVTVVLRDSSNNPLSGDSVSFVDTTNGSAVLSPSSGTLDSSGQITFTIKSNIAETENISAKDTSSNTTLDNLGYVIFTAIITPTPSITVTPTPTPAGYCGDQVPGSNPQITSAIAEGTTKITLNWTDATNPVSYYLVSYGVSSGNYLYGDPNIGGQGTTSFTIGSLTTGKKYYFVLKAVNGCGSSGFSNEVSATAGGEVTNIPTPAPLNSINESTSLPTDFPSPIQDVQSTIAPTPTPVIDSSKTPFVVAVLVGALVMTGTGGYFYWSKKKSKKRPLKLNDINSEQSTENGSQMG